MWKKLIELFKKDNLFEQAYQEASKMLDTDAAMYDASVDALRHSDTAEVCSKNRIIPIVFIVLVFYLIPLVLTWSSVANAFGKD